MGKKLFLLLALIISMLTSNAQNGKVIKDTGGGDNIYSASGALSSDRLVDLNGQKLVFKTDSVNSVQSGTEFRPGIYTDELVNHYPMIISASPNGEAADSIWFVIFDTNLSIATNTNGMKYAQANTFTSPQHIIDKAYCDANVSGATGAGKGGIYEGDGTLPEKVRVSGGPSEYLISFDSISFLEIKDWNQGQALRIFQDFSGVTKFGRGITYVGANDSLEVNYTEAGANSIFSIDATKSINIDAPNTVVNPDSISFNFGNATFTDNRASLGGATHGIKYAADYSASFVNRSLVDKAYVDAAAGTESFAIIETAASDAQTISNAAWEALEAQTSAGLSGGWTFSTTTDLLTYSGTTAKFLANFSVCFTENAANLRDYTFTVRENGVDGNARAVQRTSGADADVSYCVSGMDVVTANNTDTFGLGFISNSASVTTVTIHSSQLVMTKLVGQ